MRRVISRVLAFFRARTADVELTREIDAHLQLLEDRFVAQGLSARDARLAARRAFGGQVEQTKLRQRDARSFRWMDEGWLDIKLGARMLRKYPGLTFVGGLGMAAAIALSAVSFAFFYTYLFSTLPIDDGHRVVALENWDLETNNEWRQALHDYEVWRNELTSFEEIGAFRTIGRNLIIPGGSSEPADIAEITASGFRIARVAPILGRPLLDADERRGAPPVLVIGHDVWQSRFGSDPAVIGRPVRLGHTVHTVVGVMPAGFFFPVSHSYWVPLRTDPSPYARGTGPSIFIFGRLAPAVSITDANAELAAVGQRSAIAFPDTHRQLRPRVLPYAYPILDIQDASLWEVGLMQLMMTTLLVVVAVNVAVLVYARTATRQGEIALRTALGASRPRIIGQLFVEALVLSGLSAGLGLLIARFGLTQAHAIMQAEGGRLPYWIDYSVPWPAMLWVMGLTVIVAVIAGALPAVQATSRRVHATLRELSGSTGMRLGNTWTLLIVAQVAFAVAALPIAVALGWTEVRNTSTRPAFAVEQYLAAAAAMDPEPPDGTDPTRYRRELNQQFAAVQAKLVARLEAESWVSDVTVAMRPPGQEAAARLEVEGATALSGAGHEVRVNRVDVDFFDTFDAALLTGRRLTDADRVGSASAGAAVVVNRAFVRDVLDGHEALGRRLRYAAHGDDDLTTESRWFEIVGVIADLHVNAVNPEIVEPAMYHALTPGEAAQGSVVIRVSGGTPAGFVGRLRDVVGEIDPSVRVNVYPLVDIYRQSNAAFRLVGLALLLVIVSVLLLSAAGIYALMSFTVSQRTKEIGIRAALGADSRQLLGSIFARSARQLGIGILVGLVTAAAGDQMSGGQLLAEESAILLPAMSALVLVVGLLAAFGPARRGLTIEPTQALRDQ